MPLVVVVPLAPLVSDRVEPSTLICSAAPSVTLETVKANDLISCPASTVETAVPLNNATGVPVDTPAPSVNVPPVDAADSVGASLTGTTLTVDAIDSDVVSAPPFAVPPLSFTW